MSYWMLASMLLPALLLAGEGSAEMKKLVPRQIREWKARGRDEIYDRNTIFRYMNGAGELYRSYGFRKLLVRRFLKKGQPDIVVELYDMGSSEDAFGVFTHERMEEGVGIGQDSEYEAGWLRFWKGNFFVSIFAEGETPLAKQAILDLGQAIAQSIPTTGPKPQLLACLPSQGLINRSIRYFHNQASLNYHYFISYKNILHLNADTEAILAQYRWRENERGYLLLVRYPDEKSARDAFNSFVEAYLPEGGQTGVAQTEDGKWVAAKAQGRLVIVVFEAPTRADADTLIEGVKERCEKKDL